VDERVKEIARADQDIAFRVATVYALDNNADEAIEWLERSISMGNENYPWISANPNWEALHDDPRFQAIVEELRVKWERLSETAV
jgi:serine/threonine-protein kinase